MKAPDAMHTVLDALYEATLARLAILPDSKEVLIARFVDEPILVMALGTDHLAQALAILAEASKAEVA